MWELLGLILLIIGVLGACYQCVIFVKETIPQNYGSNPGFGSLEIMVMPWLVTASVGVWVLMQSWKWGAILYVIGVISFGFLAMLLGRLYSGQ